MCDCLSCDGHDERKCITSTGAQGLIWCGACASSNKSVAWEEGMIDISVPPWTRSVPLACPNCGDLSSPWRHFAMICDPCRANKNLS